MLLFPNAKVNIGLNVVRKRSDGYHDIETLFVPVPGLCDILEVRFSEAFEVSVLNAPIKDTLCTAAYNLLEEEFGLPPVRINLYKNIPAGAGLGGGSSDAATTLVALNRLFGLGLSDEDLALRASRLGSDCPFFIFNSPMMASGRGEILKPYPVRLEGYSISIHPQELFVSTREAYAGVTPRTPQKHLEELLKFPVEEWRDLVVNDFEQSVFAAHPSLAAAKAALYERGAVYAAMSGSGSALFAISKRKAAEVSSSTDRTSCQGR